jgi:hypothetical protein
MSWGLIKKSLKQHAFWLFLKKKSLDLLPIKVKTKNQDQSPPSKKSQIPKKDRSLPINKYQNQKRISIPLKCTTLYIYEIESLFSINFYLQLFNYNRIIIILKHLNFFLKYNKVLKTNIIQFLLLNFVEIKLTIKYEFF